MTTYNGNKLKIGIVSEYYYPYLGGIAEHVHHTFKNLKKLGMDVKIITPYMDNLKYGSDTDISADWAREEEIIRIGKSRPFYANGGFVRFTSPFNLGKRLSKVFESEKFDLIHVHAPLVPTLPIAAIQKATCPVIGTFHTFFKRSLCYRLLKNYFQGILNKIDRCIAVSPMVREAIQKYFNVNLQIIPNGVDTELYSPDTPPIPELVKDGVKNILFLGRFDPHNGLPVLLKAFEKVKASYKNCRLVVVGDGPLAPKYKNLVPSSLKPWVIFAGMQYSFKPNYIASADILCHPAIFHSFSLVCLEAMATGIPIVASDLKSFRWLLKEDGVFFPPGDSDKLAESILNLLGDKNKRITLKNKLRKRSLSFSWEIIASQLINLYCDVFEARTRDFKLAEVEPIYIPEEVEACYQNLL